MSLQLRVYHNRRGGKVGGQLKFIAILTTIRGELRNPPTGPTTNEMHNINMVLSDFPSFILSLTIVPVCVTASDPLLPLPPPPLCQHYTSNTVTESFVSEYNHHRSVEYTTRLQTFVEMCLLLCAAFSSEEIRSRQNTTPDA